MVNYQLGKIYKIVCNVTGNIYIGSTCEPTLARRLAGHRYSYKSYLNGKHDYVTSFKIIQNNDYDMVLIESYPCETKDQLHARERYYIESIECVNKNIPHSTPKESVKKYYENNKKQIQEYNKEYQKQYYQQNKEIIHDKKKEKYNCECGGIYSLDNKARHFKSIKHIKYLNTL